MAYFHMDAQKHMKDNILCLCADNFWKALKFIEDIKNLSKLPTQRHC